MNTEIQAFNFNNATLRILTDENGEPWFITKDVCDILEIRTNNLRTILDTDEISELSNDYSIDIAQNGGKSPLILSEAGLYSLTLKSRKPEAKAFKRWVTHEVLPTIRKHGIYATETTIDQILADPDSGIRLLTDLKRNEPDGSKLKTKSGNWNRKRKHWTTSPTCLTPYWSGTLRNCSRTPARRNMECSFRTRKSRSLGPGRIKIARTA